MLRIVQGGAGDAITRHTAYGELYNKPAPTRDRIMPSHYGLDVYQLLGSYPEGFRAYNTPPIISPNLNYYGRFAIADQVPVDRPLPWDRTWKMASIG